MNIQTQQTQTPVRRTEPPPAAKPQGNYTFVRTPADFRPFIAAALTRSERMNVNWSAVK
jgi:hypothetical protein